MQNIISWESFMESAESEENTKEGKRMHREGISVCMACYNGEQYIEEQIASILPQLNAGDELIVIDYKVPVIEEVDDSPVEVILDGLSS